MLLTSEVEWGTSVLVLRVGIGSRPKEEFDDGSGGRLVLQRRDPAKARFRQGAKPTHTVPRRCVAEGDEMERSPTTIVTRVNIGPDFQQARHDTEMTVPRGEVQGRPALIGTRCHTRSRIEEECYDFAGSSHGREVKSGTAA